MFFLQWVKTHWKGTGKNLQKKIPSKHPGLGDLNLRSPLRLLLFERRQVCGLGISQ